MLEEKSTGVLAHFSPELHYGFIAGTLFSGYVNVGIWDRDIEDFKLLFKYLMKVVN